MLQLTTQIKFKMNSEWSANFNTLILYMLHTVTYYTDRIPIPQNCYSKCMPIQKCTLRLIHKDILNTN